jgi:hypothetical protein
MNTAHSGPDIADERALLERAAGWPLHPAIEDLTHPVLNQLVEREGIDFATALLYDRLLRQHSIRSTLAALTANATTPQPPRNVLIGVVPGAFYKEYLYTGADGQQILDAARRLGCRAERVPLESFGSLDDNARILGDWLGRRPDEEIYLVSLSKGGTDIQHALSLPDAVRTFQNVSLWLSLSGILQGTVLADWFLAQPLRSFFVRIFAWWRGYSFHVLHEICRRENAAFANWPKHMRVAHLIGFPLRQHLSHRLAQRAHQRLEAWGPSDGGGILLADVVRWPGLLIPLWGADHYLRPPGRDMCSLVMGVLEHLATNTTPLNNVEAQATELV